MSHPSVLSAFSGINWTEASGEEDGACCSERLLKAQSFQLVPRAFEAFSTVETTLVILIFGFVGPERCQSFIIISHQGNHWHLGQNKFLLVCGIISFATRHLLFISPSLWQLNRPPNPFHSVSNPSQTYLHHLHFLKQWYNTKNNALHLYSLCC